MRYYFELFNLSKSPAATRAALNKIMDSGKDSLIIWERFNSFPPSGDFIVNDMEEAKRMISAAINHIRWIGLEIPEPPVEYNA